MKSAISPVFNFRKFSRKTDSPGLMKSELSRSQVFLKFSMFFSRASLAGAEGSMQRIFKRFSAARREASFEFSLAFFNRKAKFSFLNRGIFCRAYSRFNRQGDRKSTRLNSSHSQISDSAFCF